MVQKIVKAYERYNELIGANRQLTLKLTEPPAERPAAFPVAADPAVAPTESPVAETPVV